MGRKYVLVALLMIGLLASSYVAVQRYKVESLNKAVEIVLDYDEISQIAAITGKSPVDVMQAFKDAGATSVAVTEQTLRDDVDNGLAIPVNTHSIQMSNDNAQQIIAHLKMALPHLRLAVKPASKPQWVDLSLPDGVSISYLEQIPIGLPKEPIKAINQAELEVVARLINYPGASPESINAILHDVHASGVEKVIFSGDQVFGFKGAVKDAAKAFLANSLYFGRVEFSKQKGELELAAKTKSNVITVHSITQAEMPTLDEPSIVDRFQKGVRERGVRMCYVRMYNTASDDMLEANTDYVSAIAKAIEKAGYTLQSSHPTEEVKVPIAIKALVGIGVAAGVVLLILTVVNLSGSATFIWSIAMVIICAGLAASGDTGRKLVALLSAITFPTMAALNATSKSPKAPTQTSHPLQKAIIRLWAAIITSAVGGMLIVGLISERSFMLRIDQFAGVKLAHLLPVVILMLLYAGGVAWKSGKWKDQKQKFVKSFRELARNPILIWQAIGMIAILGVVAMMVMRSGNDSGVGVSSLELKFRSILDKVLYVRPRTKEFLIGYPALILGIAFSLRGRRQWAAPLIVIGSIGLVSALNTFCHIHTPLELSLLRVFNGAVVGSIVGSIAYWLLGQLPGREK